MRAIKVTLLWGMFLCCCISVASAKMTLETDLNKPSSEGYFSLSWTGDVTEKTILEMSPSAEFKKIDRDYPVTRDGAITLSGYGDGEFHFRLRDPESGETSNPVIVSVKHWPLDKAVGFFFVGLTLFLLLIAILFVSVRIKNSN